jgi:hypothetical protein
MVTDIEGLLSNLFCGYSILLIACLTVCVCYSINKETKAYLQDIEEYREKYIRDSDSDNDYDYDSDGGPRRGE